MNSITAAAAAAKQVATALLHLRRRASCLEVFFPHSHVFTAPLVLNCLNIYENVLFTKQYFPLRYSSDIHRGSGRHPCAYNVK